MIIPIIKDSALEYWLDGTGKDEPFRLITSTLSKTSKVFLSTDAAELLRKQLHLTKRLEIMTGENIFRGNGMNYKAYYCPGVAPASSFVKVDEIGLDNIYVSCPEQCFVYAAMTRPIHEAVAIGNMLCACYVLDRNCYTEQRKRAPITSAEKIRNYIKKSKGLYGLKKARLAAKYIVDNCNSPMEVALAVLARLPFCHGGYALPEMVMNGEIVLSAGGKKILGRDNCHADMVWYEQKKAVEYESNKFHLDKSQHEYDKKRSNAINMSGYSVIYITADQVSCFINVEETFLMLRKELGLRNRPDDMKKQLEKRREVVIDLLVKKKPLF